MSPSHTVGTAIPVSPCIEFLPSAYFSLPLGSNHSHSFYYLYTDDSHTWSQHGLAPNSGCGLYNLLVKSRVGYGWKKRSHHDETSDGHLRLHYITLCVCSYLKIFIIKRLFLRGSIRTLKKKIQERNIQLKIGVWEVF